MESFFQCKSIEFIFGLCADLLIFFVQMHTLGVNDCNPIEKIRYASVLPIFNVIYG